MLWSFLLLLCCYCEGAKHSKEAVSWLLALPEHLQQVSHHVQAKDGVESLTLVLQHAIGGGE